MVADALVDTFIMTCEDYEITLQRKFVSHMLVEAFAVGRGEDYLIVIAFGLQGTDTAVNGLALHHHSCTTAIRIVIHTAPFVERVVS